MKSTYLIWIALALSVIAIALSITQFVTSSSGTIVGRQLQFQSTGGTGGTGGECPPENPVQICTNTGAGGLGGVCWCGDYL